MDFAAVNRQIGELERRIGEPAELSPDDLGEFSAQATGLRSALTTTTTI